MRLLVVALVAGLMASGGLLVLNVREPGALASSGDRLVEIGGGTIAYSSAVQGGDRFLKKVPVPEHLVDPYEPAAQDETPGDGHDDELLVTQRRHTDHSWWTKPVTGRVEIFNVHGTPTNPVCICDVEFVLSNETEQTPGVFVWIRYSSHVLVDNVTVYGGQLEIDDSSDITVSRSRFFNAFIGTFASVTTDILVWDNDFSQAEGPLAAMRTDPLLYTPTGIDECWPNPSCRFSGIGQAGVGIRWTVMWNYFNAGGPGAFAFNYVDFHVEHNTLMHPETLVGGFHGNNYVGWNLLRGFGISGIEIGASDGGTAIVENNSIVMNLEAYPLGDVVAQEPGVRVRNDCVCLIRFNDFIGYGTRLPVFAQKGGSPALTNLGGHVTANDNHWGTIHDPTLPPDRWIRTNSGATTIVERWFTEPIHAITPSAYPLNEQDAERWIDEAPKRIPRSQEHLETWIENGCEFYLFELCKVPPVPAGTDSVVRDERGAHLEGHMLTQSHT